MTYQITLADAVIRITEVLEAIATSEEWKRLSVELASMNWLDGRDSFRRFFDVYEGQDGEEWLGIMEWAVIEEMRSRGGDLTVDPATTDSIVARMSGHRDIELVR